MADDFGSELTPAELWDLRRLVGFMVPSSTDYRVPGANDGAIFADIVRSLGRDQSAVREALAMLREMAGGDLPRSTRPRRRRRRWRYSGVRGPRSRHSGVQCCNATTATSA